MVLGELLKISGPLFSHLWNGDGPPFHRELM